MKKTTTMLVSIAIGVAWNFYYYHDLLSAHNGNSLPGIKNADEFSNVLPAIKRSDINSNTTGRVLSTSEVQWHQLSKQLCPNMKPNSNPKVQSILFELARMELGFAKDRTKPNPMNQRFTRHFFNIDVGGFGFSFQNKTTNMVYLTVWKGANNVIQMNLDAALSKKGRTWRVDNTNKLWTPIPKSHRKRTCVVTAVRDPVGHFLSGYNEMEQRVYDGICDRVEHSWKTRANSKLPLFTQHNNGTTARFQQFVADFVGGAATSGLYPSKPNWNIYHVFSMTSVLRGLGSRATDLTAYLPSITNLEIEFPKMLARRCTGLPKEAGNRWVLESKHGSQNDEHGFYSAAKRVWGAHGATARALCAIHAMDYACFDLIPIPGVCQSVFSDKNFHDRVMQAAR